MTKTEARKLHNEDEVKIKKTGDVATVLSVYEKDGQVIIETDYHGFTSFYADELGQMGEDNGGISLF